jgi:hypothetical protein
MVGLDADSHVRVVAVIKGVSPELDKGAVSALQLATPSGGGSDFMIDCLP